MDIIARVNKLLGEKEVFCLVTVVDTRVSGIPQGRKAIVSVDGSMEGGLGDQRLNAQVRDIALRVLKDKNRRIAAVGDGMRLFFDILASETTLLICGAGHIAVPLARFARDVGFRVCVLDDRGDFAHPLRFPGCDVIAEEFSIALRDIVLGASVYVVVITRGHEHDVDCLLEILKKDAAYVGLIGSRRRVGFVLELLEKEGISPKRLQEVFTPIGIPIGAESPEEIALSIIAELVCVRRKGAAQARALRAAVGIDR